MLKSRVIAALLFVFGCVLITVTSGSAQQVWLWSQTPGTNASVDPFINWAEGMAPSAVNDSARAMMAGVAKARDDWSGALAASGTATAFTVSSNQGFGSLANLNNQQICFTPGTTNGSGVTLSVDSLTAEPIDSAPSVPIGAGVMVAGTPYCVVYNNASTTFYLRSAQGNPFNVPLGVVLDYTGATAPNSNFALAYGQCISRTTYAAYFALVSTTFGACDGVTTFGIPDLRGLVVAGVDGMGGTPANRITLVGSGINGAVIGGAGGAQNKAIAQANLPSVNFAVTIPAGQGSHTHSPGSGSSFVDAGASGATYTASNQTGGQSQSNATLTASATLPAMTGSAASGGSGSALVTMPPTMVLNKILRILGNF